MTHTHKFKTYYLLKSNIIWRVNKCSYCSKIFYAVDTKLRKKLIFSNILREKEREHQK
jgi:heme exporter protein D